MDKTYLFTSDRLGFRPWDTEDVHDFHIVNSDPAVMKHFPKTLSEEETAAIIERFQQHYKLHGHCYFAPDLLANGECIGFIGLGTQDFPADFTPCVDIGWRLKKAHWGKGYATEGAKACLTFGWEQLGLEEIYAIAVEQNHPSIRVMEKIGMGYHGHFFHPKLVDFPHLQRCVVYQIGK